MSDNDIKTEQEKSTLLMFLSDAKIVASFVALIFVIAGTWYDTKSDIRNLQKEIVTMNSNIAKLEARVVIEEKTSADHRVTLSEVTLDLKYIKDAQKETLDLVRKLNDTN